MALDVPPVPDALSNAGAWVVILGSLVAVPAGTIATLYRFALKPRLERMERTIEAVEYHLQPNGHEDALSQEDRDKPVRTLLINTAVTVQNIKGALDRDLAWQVRHETQHVRKDETWQADAMERVRQ